MRSESRGFTLIEIMVVVTILAIVSLIAIPMMSSDSLSVPSAARMVMSDILLAQNNAVTLQKKTFVCFMADDQSPQKTAYTIAYFSGNQVPAPSFADVKAGTYAAGTLLKQPTTQSRFLVQFGSKASGPLARTKISSIKLGSVTKTAPFEFGFDSLGQPIDKNGATIMDTIMITISNNASTQTETLTISPITGEIKAN